MKIHANLPHPITLLLVPLIIAILATYLSLSTPPADDIPVAQVQTPATPVLVNELITRVVAVIVVSILVQAVLNGLYRINRIHSTVQAVAIGAGSLAVGLFVAFSPAGSSIVWSIMHRFQFKQFDQFLDVILLVLYYSLMFVVACLVGFTQIAMIRLWASAHSSQR